MKDSNKKTTGGITKPTPLQLALQGSNPINVFNLNVNDSGELSQKNISASAVATATSVIGGTEKDTSNGASVPVVQPTLVAEYLIFYDPTLSEYVPVYMGRSSNKSTLEYANAIRNIIKDNCGFTEQKAQKSIRLKKA